MKVVVITGGASGIGLALSEIYLQSGFQVLVLDKNQKALSDLQHKHPEIHSFYCDVTSKQALEVIAKDLFQRYGKLDLIYNNAGIMGELKPVWELDLETLRQTMDVNLFGMVNLIQAFMPYLLEQKSPAHLINMASMYALCAGTQVAGYAMSKHAVLALSESLYFDLKCLEKQVDVSVVFPSFTDTALLTKTDSSASPLEESLQALLAHSRPAMDVAQHIVQEVEKKRFYILPDKEVKSYCEERNQAIILQEPPHQHNIDKLISSLLRRKSRSKG